jgi:tetratricopeptide (TPR) repeat protein
MLSSKEHILSLFDKHGHGTTIISPTNDHIVDKPSSSTGSISIPLHDNNSNSNHHHEKQFFFPSSRRTKTSTPTNKPFHDFVGMLLNNCFCHVNPTGGGSTAVNPHDAGRLSSQYHHSTNNDDNNTNNTTTTKKTGNNNIFFDLPNVAADYLYSTATEQFVELHGIRFIGLGAVIDELTPRQRVYDTLEQLTIRTERLISIGYLMDHVHNSIVIDHNDDDDDRNYNRNNNNYINIDSNNATSHALQTFVQHSHGVIPSRLTMAVAERFREGPMRFEEGDTDDEDDHDDDGGGDNDEDDGTNRHPNGMGRKNHKKIYKSTSIASSTTAPPSQSIQDGDKNIQKQQQQQQHHHSKKKKTTECVPLDVWRQFYPHDANALSSTVKSIVTLVNQQDYSRALRQLQHTYEVQKTNVHRGNNKYLVGITAHNIGVIQVLLNNPSDDTSTTLIIPWFQDAIHYKENAFGLHHPEVALSWDELGIQYFANANYSQALIAFQRAHMIRTGSTVPVCVPPDTENIEATSLPVISDSSINQDIPLQPTQRDISTTTIATATTTATAGTMTAAQQHHHPSVAMVLNNIACCYFQMGDHPAALQHLEAASRVQQNVVARDNTSISADLDVLHVATVMGNCGYLHLALKHYEIASALFEDALLIQQSVLGDYSHRAVRDTMSNIDFTNAFHS